MAGGIWGLYWVTASRHPKGTEKIKLRRTTLVVYPFSHFFLSTTSLNNPQGIMVKFTSKDLMPVIGSRCLSTANLPSLLLSLKYRSAEELLQFLRKKTTQIFLPLLPLKLTGSRAKLLPRSKRKSLSLSLSIIIIIIIGYNTQVTAY